ncbi:hypothetical protein DFR24_4102 [Panacagrimonas perspica]|uniref:Uncharacterized protein n=1 Tax=Panacagrimonas perspica TaxID=381431 RepID=A0A4R7NWY6_9GAMM|nr:hypothetical protein DFR24_4102 [Panacagrimonas perspica]
MTVDRHGGSGRHSGRNGVREMSKVAASFRLLSAFRVRP